MKGILILFLISTSSFSFGQNFSIDTISEKSPLFPGDIYRFPIVTKGDKGVCEKINAHHY